VVEDPTNKPSTPTRVIAENPSTDSIDVTWNPPTGTQGVDQYIVEKLQHGHENWVECAKIKSPEMAITISDLDQETKYIFRVFAENECGRSLPSEMSNPCITLTGSGKYFASSNANEVKFRFGFCFVSYKIFNNCQSFCE